jgi:hypothetical protein
LVIYKTHPWGRPRANKLSSFQKNFPHIKIWKKKKGQGSQDFLKREENRFVSKLRMTDIRFARFFLLL